MPLRAEALEGLGLTDWAMPVPVVAKTPAPAASFSDVRRSIATSEILQNVDAKKAPVIAWNEADHALTEPEQRRCIGSVCNVAHHRRNPQPVVCRDPRMDIPDGIARFDGVRVASGSGRVAPAKKVQLTGLAS